MAKIMLEAEQAIRDAECKHFDEIKVGVSIEYREASVEEAEALFASIRPPYKGTKRVERFGSS
jgi:hypothetical protein